ncbi:MAG: glycosyltransferase [Acidobacteria bacterium]|nr:glycosyltransferase [Acidobacteriota bacterium]
MFALHLDSARTWRGGQQQVLLTVLGMRARGHRAVLVAHPEGVLYQRASEGDDLVPLAPRSEVDLTAAWRLARVIAMHRPDVVHAHDPHTVAMASMALSFGVGQAVPTLVASRRVDFHLQKHSFSRWKYKQVACFIAASEAIAGILAADGIPRARITVVHDGIDVDRVTHIPAANLHQEFWFPHGSPVLVNVGALVPHKGQKFLVDAMARVRRSVPDAQLVIFGEGELRPALEAQIRELGLHKHVVLAGFRDDVLALTKSADVFVMSSVTEGLGSTLLDAMAMGLAIVGTRAGGIPEAVVDGTTGLLVPPGNSEALADAIVRLLGDATSRRRMGDAGRARVAAQFGVDRLVDGTLAVYERLRPGVSRV